MNRWIQVSVPLMVTLGDLLAGEKPTFSVGNQLAEEDTQVLRGLPLCPLI